MKSFFQLYPVEDTQTINVTEGMDIRPNAKLVNLTVNGGSGATYTANLPATPDGVSFTLKLTNLDADGEGNDATSLTVTAEGSTELTLLFNAANEEVSLMYLDGKFLELQSDGLPAGVVLDQATSGVVDP